MEILRILWFQSRYQIGLRIEQKGLINLQHFYKCLDLQREENNQGLIQMIVTQKDQSTFERGHAESTLGRLILSKGWAVARNKTFVYWTRPDNNSKNAILTHADIDGSILYERLFVQPSRDKDPLMLMLSQDQVVVTVHRQNILSCVNLQTHEVSYLRHNFIRKPEGIKLYLFPQTHMICVVEYRKQNDHVLRLTYYALPFTEDSKPVVIYQSKLINAFLQAFKGNNRSMVVWSHSSQNKLELQTYDLEQQRQNRHHRIIASRDYLVASVLRNIWQLKKGVLCLVSEKYQGVYQNLKLDVTLVMASDGSTRQANFIGNMTHPKHQLILCGNMGEICYFQLRETAKKSRIFYIHNQSEQVMHVQLREVLKGYKYLGVSYEPNMLYEICLHRYMKKAYSKVSLVTRTAFLRREMILHLLLQVNEDCDDDLLKDAVQLIGYQ